jgi:peptide/nickel transport system substrate-binding protein
VWEAVRWLIDYNGIAGKLLQGQFEVHQAMLPTGFPGALNTTPYRLDVAKARSILAAAGLGGGVTIKLDVFNQPPFIDIAQSMQATFAQGGINLQLLPTEAAEVYARIRSRQEEAAWLYWVPDYFDANSTAAAFASNGESGAGDTPAILGGTLLIGCCFVFINRLADLLARTLDPRIR